MSGILLWFVPAWSRQGRACCRPSRGPPVSLVSASHRRRRSSICLLGADQGDGAAALTSSAIEALHAEVEWLMLDNMSIGEMRYIVVLRGTEGPRLEASGNVTLSTVRSVAQTGVDAISVGGITHSAPAFDLSLLLTPTTLAGESPRAAADGRPAQRFG
ncbi:hypothetical protein ACH4SK_39290 [Streptomyces inhibens]|uniref:hypothetical protein n=1 Tax=Streptomyces inhibens TaxID=2293571 RepID=UPI00378B7F2F